MDHSIDNAHIARALVVPTAQTVAAPGFAAVTTVRDARKRNGHDTHSTVVSALKDLSNGGESNSSAVVVDERVYQERVEMCEFLVQCAASLLLDQASTLTALVLAQNFSQYDARLIAGACLFISTKSCEVPRTLRSVANVVHAVANDTDEPLGTGSRYSDLKMTLINAEQAVLRVLGFEVDVAMPFNFLFSYARQNRFSASTVHCALKLASDAYFDARALDLPAFVVAAASLRIASVILLEDQHAAHGEKWWYLYDTSDEDIARVAQILLQVYRFTDQQRAARRAPPLAPAADHQAPSSEPTK
ncbi:hypothetical protein Gpo141_00008628 [Globisporangium polare]